MLSMILYRCNLLIAIGLWRRVDGELLGWMGRYDELVNTSE